MAPAARLPGLRGAALFTSLKRMRSMRSTMDLTPLYRASIGFDRIADLMDRALASDIATPTYPPYNIEKTGENAYRISIAVAGFTADDLSVEMKDGAVIVSARKVEEDQGRTFLAGDAAADRDHHARTRLLELPDAAKVSEHLLLRLLAHRAGVEHDQVRVGEVARLGGEVLLQGLCLPGAQLPRCAPGGALGVGGRHLGGRAAEQ